MAQDSKEKGLQLEIVSLGAPLFSGAVRSIVASGQMGELGIYPGHTALLTALKPGQIEIVLMDGRADVFYISGGFLEVQPEKVTVLADTAQRAIDLDEAAALAVQAQAARKLSLQKTSIEYSRALIELAEAAAQLRAMEALRKKSRA